MQYAQCYTDLHSCRPLGQWSSSSFVGSSTLSAAAFLITSAILGVSLDLLSPVAWARRSIGRRGEREAQRQSQTALAALDSEERALLHKTPSEAALAAGVQVGGDQLGRGRGSDTGGRGVSDRKGVARTGSEQPGVGEESSQGDIEGDLDPLPAASVVYLGSARETAAAAAADTQRSSLTPGARTSQEPTRPNRSQPRPALLQRLLETSDEEFPESQEPDSIPENAPGARQYHRIHTQEAGSGTSTGSSGRPGLGGHVRAEPHYSGAIPDRALEDVIAGAQRESEGGSWRPLDDLPPTGGEALGGRAPAGYRGVEGTGTGAGAGAGAGVGGATGAGVGGGSVSGKGDGNDATFDFPQYYSYNMTAFAVVLFYAPLAPVILPAGLLYFGYRFLVDKYNFLFVYRKSRKALGRHATDGAMVELVLQIKQLCLCGAVGAQAMFFWVKGDGVGSMSVLLGVVPLALGFLYVLSSTDHRQQNQSLMLSAFRERTVESVLRGRPIPYAVAAATLGMTQPL